MKFISVQKVPSTKPKPISLKANNLARAVYKFSLIEKRVMEALIMAIEAKGKDAVVELKAEDYAKLYDCNLKNAYRDLDQAGRSLVRKVITIRDDQNMVDEITLLSRRTYMKGQGILSARFNTEALPYLTGLKTHITLLDLSGTGRFSTFYTWRIYELLCSWGSFKCFEVSVEDLRIWCAIPSSYQYSKIKTAIIQRAIDEINNHTYLHAGYNEMKKNPGKRVTHISFFVDLAPETKTVSKPDKPQIDLINRFKSEGFSDKHLKTLIELRQSAKLPVTQVVIDALVSEILKAVKAYQIDIDEILLTLGKKGWKDLKAEWLAQKNLPFGSYANSSKDYVKKTTPPKSFYKMWEDIKKERGY